MFVERKIDSNNFHRWVSILDASTVFLWRPTDRSLEHSIERHDDKFASVILRFDIEFKRLSHHSNANLFFSFVQPEDSTVWSRNRFGLMIDSIRKRKFLFEKIDFCGEKKNDDRMVLLRFTWKNETKVVSLNWSESTNTDDSSIKWKRPNENLSSRDFFQLIDESNEILCVNRKQIWIIDVARNREDICLFDFQRSTLKTRTSTELSLVLFYFEFQIEKKKFSFHKSFLFVKLFYCWVWRFVGNPEVRIFARCCVRIKAWILSVVSWNFVDSWINWCKLFVESSWIKPKRSARLALFLRHS